MNQQALVVTAGAGGGDKGGEGGEKKRRGKGGGKFSVLTAIQASNLERIGASPMQGMQALP